MKRLCLLLLLFAPSCFAQRTASNPLGGNLVVQDAGTCSTSGSFLWQVLPSNAATTTVNLAGSFSGTVTVRESNNGGGSWTTAGTQTAVGTASYSTNGFTDICADVTTYTSGSISVTISTGLNTGPVGPAGPTGGVVATPGAIPGTAGLNAVPVTSGLMAEYRMLATETPASLVDYSGNSNNATGTVNTAPTIIANTGGLLCPATGAVVLPAALNTAKTILITSYAGTIGGGQIAPILGNGNGAASGGTGILYVNVGLPAFGDQAQGGFHIQSTNGGVTVYAQSKSSTIGLSTVTLVMDTVDRLYVNGTDRTSQYYNQLNSTSGTQTTGAYQLCGAATGLASAAWFPAGKIYYAAFWNRVLNPSEVFQATLYVQQALNARGVLNALATSPVNANFVTASTDAGFQADQILADGDSITFGFGTGGIYYPLLLNNYGGFTASIAGLNFIDQGFSGETMQNMMLGADQGVDPYYRPNAARNLVLVWGGTNDGNVAAEGYLRKYCLERRAVGWKCVPITMVSRTGSDTWKNTYNTWIRAHWREFADGLADIAADPNLGADGANASAVYFQGDHIHPTAQAVYDDELPLIQRAINRVYGNTDFSTANTYTTFTPAAQTTTSGSSSGFFNTIIFASNSIPASACVVITGVTPAGYNSPANSCWPVLTQTGTQIVIENTVSGLGAISVQGTVTPPMQKDVDVNFILNAGAGTFILETCQGYTGQNISIRNINAAATTLAPQYASETITGGGATPTTLAANTTAILQAQLVTAAAGGCTWVRTQ